MSSWLLVLLLVLVYAGWRFFSGYPRPPIPLRALAAREYATIAAASLATYPRGGAIEPSGIDAGVPAHVDRFVAAQPPSTRLLMRLLFALVEHGTLLFPAPGLGFARFSALRDDQQVAYLQSWQQSRLLPRRLVFVSLRAILTMGYFADPAVLRALGLAPRAIVTPVIEADLLWPRIGASPASIDVAPGDVTTGPSGLSLGAEGPLHPDYEGRA